MDSALITGSHDKASGIADYNCSSTQIQDKGKARCKALKKGGKQLGVTRNAKEVHMRR